MISNKAKVKRKYPEGYHELKELCRTLERELAETNTSHGKTLLMCDQTIKQLKSELLKWQKIASNLVEFSKPRVTKVDQYAKAMGDFTAINETLNHLASQHRSNPSSPESSSESP